MPEFCGDSAGLRVLLTGGRGFVGSRLIRALAARHPDWVVSAPPADAGGARDALDISDAAAVSSWIQNNKPDVVVHLAAVSAVTTSLQDPRKTWEVNLQGTQNIVLSMQEYTPKAHLIYISSSEIYGASFRSGVSLDETALLQPLNPYAASKASADILVRQAAASGLSATIMRPFNHIGPGQSEAFVAPNFAAQIARIEAGKSPPIIHVGSLNEERDFLDVDDVVEAYRLVIANRSLVREGEVFNVSSDRSVRIGEILDILLSYSHIPIEVKFDEQRMRRVSIERAVGDSSRLRNRLGWQPSIPLRDTLLSILMEQRGRFANGS